MGETHRKRTETGDDDVVARLRESEPLCYRIAYYVLQDERLAIRAASEALLELGRLCGWSAGTAEERRERAKRATMRACLRTNAERCKDGAPVW